MFIERFIQYLQFEKRFSPNTVTAYKNDLDQFSQFLVSFQTELLNVLPLKCVNETNSIFSSFSILSNMSGLL